MSKPVIKHNPAFLTDRELENAFVIRRIDLELILGTIRENTAASNQHLLIIGPRGMGKTMLVRRTAAYVNADAALSKLWYPIIFSEESYEIGSAAEFWLHAVYHLGIQTDSTELQEHHDRLRDERDERRLYEKSLACLMDFAESQKKRLLVVVENLNMIFDDQIHNDQAWDIRQTLQTEPRIMLLATAPTRFDEIDNANRAMYDLFKIHPLEPLDTKEAAILWGHLIDEKTSETKVRPLQILTGGNPRLLTIMSEFAAGIDFKELMSRLTTLIDEYTNYFKSNIESLPPLERKVFVTLANIWEPATAARVAQETRMAVAEALSNLKRLESRGAVTIVKVEKGESSFQVTERLYNIYHLMRKSGNKSNRVLAVVDFMVNFYEEKELAQKVAKLTTEACSLKIEQRGDHLEAVKLILEKMKDGNARQKVINAISPEFLKLPDVQDYIKANVVPKKSELYNIFRLIQEFVNMPEIPENIKKKDVIELLGIIFSVAADGADQAINLLKTLVKLKRNDFEAWQSLGFAFYKQHRYKRALKTLQKAHEINPNNANVMIYMGAALTSLNKADDAIPVLKKAVDLEPQNALAWGVLCSAQYMANSIDESEESIKQAILLDPENTEYYKVHANLLRYDPNRTDEAEEVIRRVVERVPDDSLYILMLSDILAAQNKWSEALPNADKFTKDASLAQSNPEDTTKFFTSAAAAGYAKESLKILQDSPAAQHLEPLVVALQMETGIDVNAPQEVMEIAKDIRTRIEEKRKTLNAEKSNREVPAK